MSTPAHRITGRASSRTPPPTPKKNQKLTKAKIRRDDKVRRTLNFDAPPPPPATSSRRNKKKRKLANYPFQESKRGRTKGTGPKKGSRPPEKRAPYNHKNHANLTTAQLNRLRVTRQSPTTALFALP